MQVLLPAGWPRPRGYANGVVTRGRQVYIAGMIGWDAQGVFHSDDFATREAAAAELARHGPGAAGQARASAATDARLEVRRRLGRALAEWDQAHGSLRDRRAVMALDGGASLKSPR
jgi:hypothetical protein